MRTRKNQVKYFTEKEKERFLTEIELSGNMRDRMIAKLFFATGLRLSELNSLCIEKVRDKETGLMKHYLEVVGKGNKERTLPLKAEVQQELKNFLEWKHQAGESLHPNAPLFCNPLTKKRLSNRAIQFRVNYYSKKAGLERLFSPHAFRHTVGFQLGKKGISIQVIKKLLGHSNINTTAIYVEPDLDQMSQALGVL